MGREHTAELAKQHGKESKIVGLVWSEEVRAGLMSILDERKEGRLGDYTEAFVGLGLLWLVSAI